MNKRVILKDFIEVEEGEETEVEVLIEADKYDEMPYRLAFEEPVSWLTERGIRQLLAQLRAARRERKLLLSEQ